MPLGYFITTSWSVVYKSKIVWLPNSMHGNKMLRCKFTRNRTGFLILTWKGLPRDIRGCPRKKVCESGSLSIKTNGLCSLDNISLPRWVKFFFSETPYFFMNIMRWIQQHLQNKIISFTYIKTISTCST